MIDGVVVRLSGKEYMVPPMSFKSAGALKDRIQLVMDGSSDFMSEAYVDAIFDIYLAAIQRNYPDMTRERLQEIVDLGNFDAMTVAAFGRGVIVKGESAPPVAAATDSPTSTSTT